MALGSNISSGATGPGKTGLASRLVHASKPITGDHRYITAAAIAVSTRLVAAYHRGTIQMNGTAELSPVAQQRPRPPPSTLTTLPQVLSSLSSLESEETELSNSLSALLSDQEPIQNALTRLQSLLPSIDELHTEASALSRKVSVTARTAERVGGRVRTLDEEMRRVREASDRVQQVMELKVRRFRLLPYSRLTCSLHVLVIIILSSVVNRRARLGIGDSTLFTSHGPPRGCDQWRFCRDSRRKFIFFRSTHYPLSLIFLSLHLHFRMIAFFGESVASRTDTTRCADASPSGFHASVHRGNQGSGRGGHNAVFQALPSNWLGN